MDALLRLAVFGVEEELQEEIRHELLLLTRIRLPVILALDLDLQPRLQEHLVSTAFRERRHLRFREFVLLRACKKGCDVLEVGDGLCVSVGAVGVYGYYCEFVILELEGQAVEYLDVKAAFNLFDDVRYVAFQCCDESEFLCKPNAL